MQRLKNSLRILILIQSLSGCALVGSGPGLTRAQDYKLVAPAGWQTRSREDSDRAYRLTSGSVVTLVSSCNRNSGAPLEVLTRQLLIGTRNVQVVQRERRTAGKNQGLFSKVLATVDNVPFHLDLFVLAKDNCVFDFSMVSPTAIKPADEQEFLQFVGSFEYGKD